MTILEMLEGKFAGSVLDDPIGVDDIIRFESVWNRKLSNQLREFLTCANGVEFEDAVYYKHWKIHAFSSLSGIESTLRVYGDYAFAFIVPFASTLSEGVFCLDSRETTSPVYILSPLTEAAPEFFSLSKVAESLNDFVAGMYRGKNDGG